MEYNRAAVESPVEGIDRVPRDRPRLTMDNSIAAVETPVEGSNRANCDRPHATMDNSLAAAESPVEGSNRVTSDQPRAAMDDSLAAAESAVKGSSHVASDSARTKMGNSLIAVESTDGGKNQIASDRTPERTPEHTEQSADRIITPPKITRPFASVSQTTSGQQTPSDSTSECNSENIEGLRRAVNASYGGASFSHQATETSNTYAPDGGSSGQPWVPGGLGDIFPIPEISSDHMRIRRDENLEKYGQRMKKDGYHDMRRMDNGGLVFRSTVMGNGVRGVAWEGENKYRARNGTLYDTTNPPPGRCFNCNGNHWRKDCPRGGRR